MFYTINMYIYSIYLYILIYKVYKISDFSTKILIFLFYINNGKGLRTPIIFYVFLYKKLLAQFSNC